MKKLLVGILVMLSLVGCKMEDRYDEQTEDSLTGLTEESLVETLQTMILAREEWIRNEENLAMNESSMGLIYTEGIQEINNSSMRAAKNVFTSKKINIKYVERRSPYWQTAKETDTSRTGICIDIAISAYMELRKQGYSDSNIGIVIFFPPVAYNGHMVDGHALPVLFVNGNMRDWVRLDILTNEPWQNMVPVYAFNLFDSALLL